MQLFGSVEPLTFSLPRLLIVADKDNPASAPIVKRLRKWSHPKPNLIAVVGGDGFMIRSIRKHWRKGIPFFGINAGHRGFLLNPKESVGRTFPDVLSVHHLPLLEIETVAANGAVKNSFSVNDAWVERATGQTAWIEISIDGKVRLPKMVADGALVAVPTGSTAYAAAMGASPVPLISQTLVLAGSNVSLPLVFRPVNLPLNSKVQFRNLAPVRRPMNGFVDGIRVGKIERLTVSVSKTASIRLAFIDEHLLAQKLIDIQFPQK